jgi:hypothetical protein
MSEQEPEVRVEVTMFEPTEQQIQWLQAVIWAAADEAKIPRQCMPRIMTALAVSAELGAGVPIDRVVTDLRESAAALEADAKQLAEIGERRGG